MMKIEPEQVNAPPNTHLLVMVVQGGEVVGQRILDLARGGHRPLLKELAFRAVASDPARLAGRPWEVHLALEGADTDKPKLRCEARLKDQARSGILALRVPVANFAWVGMAIARDLKLKDYSIHVAVPRCDHPTVRQSLDWEDDDFAVSLEGQPELVLPTEFSTEPLGPRRVIHRVGKKGTWLKCVFEPGAWITFLDAAARETREERGWLASARMHLAEGACFVVLEELWELPAEAGQCYLHTQGHEFFRLHQRLGPRLGGYLHLHPREVEGVVLGPSPSGPDVTVAWNMEAASTLWQVLPIAMFGTSPETCTQDVAAYAFRGGVIGEIDLEVVR